MGKRYEFEEEAPLELHGEDQLEAVSKTEVDATTKLDNVFQKDEQKSERKERMKKTPKPLKLSKRTPKQKVFKNTDTVSFRCTVCDKDYTHAKKDDDGHFMPFALCQHVIFQGVDIVE